LTATRLNTIFLLLLFLALHGCAGDEEQDNLFYFDFEHEQELDDYLRWECWQLYSRSREHVTHGDYSLQVELFPSAYPGLKIDHFDPDWSDYSELHFDVYNPEPAVLPLHIRIDDKQGTPDFQDRFNGTVMLSPGAGHYVLRLDSLVTSDRTRRLRLDTIEGIYFFVVNPPEKVELYFDFLHLE